MRTTVDVLDQDLSELVAQLEIATYEMEEAGKLFQAKQTKHSRLSHKIRLLTNLRDGLVHLRTPNADPEASLGSTDEIPW